MVFINDFCAFYSYCQNRFLYCRYHQHKKYIQSSYFLKFQEERIYTTLKAIYSLRFFSYQRQLIDFHWSLIDGETPQVSWNLLSILAVFNNVVVWKVSTRPPTSKSTSPFDNPLVTVPKAPITIGIIVTFIFYSFFNFLARSRYLYFYFHFFTVLFCGQPEQQSRQFCMFASFCWFTKINFWSEARMGICVFC